MFDDDELYDREADPDELVNLLARATPIASSESHRSAESRRIYFPSIRGPHPTSRIRPVAVAPGS